MLTAIIAGLFVVVALVIAFGLWVYIRGRDLGEASRDYEGRARDIPPDSPPPHDAERPKEGSHGA